MIPQFHDALYVSIGLLVFGLMLYAQKIFLKHRPLEDIMRTVWLSLFINMILWVAGLFYLLGPGILIIIIMTLFSGFGWTFFWVFEIINSYQERVNQNIRQQASRNRENLHAQ